MKKKLVIASLSASILTLLLIGCGDAGDDEKEKKEFSDLSKISISFNQSSRIEQSQNSRITTNKMSRHKEKQSFRKVSSNKLEEYECPLGGSYSSETEDGVTIENNDQCIYTDTDTGLNVYENGKVAYYDSGKVIYENYFYSSDTSESYYFEGTEEAYYTGWTTDYFVMDFAQEGNIQEMKLHGSTTDYIKDEPLQELTYTNFIVKWNESADSWYYEGSYLFKVLCYSEQYSLQTKDDDWLVESGDYFTKGTIDINNIRYSYHGSKVTLSTQDEEGTFEQDALEQKIEDNIKEEVNKCSI